MASGSGENRFLNFVNRQWMFAISLPSVFFIISVLKRDVALHFKHNWISFTRGFFCAKFGWKLVQWFWKKKSLNLSMYFCFFVFISLEKYPSPHLNTLESPFTQIFGWNWPSGSVSSPRKDENVKSLQTNGRTYGGGTTGTWAFSSGALKYLSLSASILMYYENTESANVYFTIFPRSPWPTVDFVLEVFLSHWQFFTHLDMLETSSLPMKCSIFWPRYSVSWSLSREGSLSWHTYRDMGHSFI